MRSARQEVEAETQKLWLCYARNLIWKQAREGKWKIRNDAVRGAPHPAATIIKALAD